jgi:hypothetical protein
MGSEHGDSKTLMDVRNSLSIVYESVVHDVRKLPRVLRKWNFSRRDDQMKDHNLMYVCWSYART